MEKEFWLMIKIKYIKDSSSKMKNKGKEHLLMQMEINILVNGKIIKKMDMVQWYGAISNIKVNGKIIFQMELENWFGLMINLMENY